VTTPTPVVVVVPTTPSPKTPVTTATIFTGAAARHYGASAAAGLVGVAVIALAF
jgi:hypothetical protein